MVGFGTRRLDPRRELEEAILKPPSDALTEQSRQAEYDRLTALLV
jgi:hypothetical protein